MTQSVSHFGQSIACRKEGNFAANRYTRNLFVINSLRRAITATGVEGCAPVSPTCLSPRTGANLAPKGLRICLLQFHLCSSFIPKNFHWQESYRSASRQDRGGDRNPHRHRSDPHTIENAWMKWHVRNGVHLRVERNEMVIPRHE